MATVDYSPEDVGGYDNPYINTLIAGTRWSGTITYTFVNANGQVWSAAERAAFEQVLDIYREITLLDFDYVSTPAEANWDWYKVPGSTWNDPNTLADHDFPQETDAQGRFDYEEPTWANLEVGSIGFFVLLHELGHGLGLAHPHDGGPYSSELFPGVAVDGDDNLSDNLGTNQLNQTVWTMMSYNFGWNGAPPPSDDSYGHVGTPMAFDIAALQELYGRNTETRNGATTYQLPTGSGPTTSTDDLVHSDNSSGAYWTAIWDGGGYDTISNEGSSFAATIDLRAAPLTGANAGGYISRINSIEGGYTIAKGVSIEKAIGGSGADTLIGNNGNNLLEGGASGDNLIGGDGDDIATYARSADRVKIDLEAGTALEGEAQGDTFDSIEWFVGTAGADELKGDGAANTFLGGDGIDILEGRGGNDSLRGGLGRDVIIGGDDNDFMYGADSDLIENGGFESFSSDLVVDSSGYSNNPHTLGGWLSFGAGVEELFTAAAPDVDPYEGEYALDLEVPGSGNTDLRQRVDRADEGVRYRIAFEMRKAAADASAALEVLWGGNLERELEPDTEWQTIEIEVVGGAGSFNDGTRNLLQFRERGGVDNYGTLIDNVRMYRIGGIYGDGVDPFLDDDDSFFGGTGVDVVFGHGGDDTAKFDDMDLDAFDGGSGTDTLIADWTNNAARVVYRPYDHTNSGAIGVSHSYYSASNYLNFVNVEKFDLTGSAYDDELVGGSMDDILRGGDGDDKLTAGGGIDVIHGGEGHDEAVLSLAVMEHINRAAAASATGFTLSDGTRLISIESISIQAGEGDDTYDVRGSLTAGTGPARFDGGGGSDTFKVDLANSNTAYFDGGAGTDTFVIDWSMATTEITFFSPHGTVNGHFQYGFRTGEDPDDFAVDMIAVEKMELYAGSGDDVLEGLVQGLLPLGSDIINPGTGRDEIDFKTGSDTLVLDWKHVERDIVYATASLPYHAGYQGPGYSAMTPIRPIGTLEDGYDGAFGFWADDYYNNDEDRVDFKGAEHFHLTLGAGRDLIATGDGDDTIIGNGGGDWYDTGKGLDTIDGGGDARWQADKSNVIQDMMIDVSITDPLTIQSTYALGNRTATVKGVSALGWIDSDPATDGDASTAFKTGSGNDTIALRMNSSNYVSTGDGSDTVTARFGYTRAELGANSDKLVLNWSIAAQRLDGAVSGSLAGGYSGFIGGTETFWGQTSKWGSDFTGVETFEVLTGSLGSQIATGDGSDSLTGGSGADVFSSGGGADTLNGGAGNDTLTGGGEADIFRFSLRGNANVDTITDYSFGEGDKIDLTLLAGSGTWSPTRPLSSVVRVEQFGSAAALFVDISLNTTPSWSKVADLTGVTAGQQVRIQLNAETTAISVTGVGTNAAPTNIALSNASAFENSAAGTVVGTLSTTDPDSGEVFSYALTNNANGRFAVQGGSLVVSGPLDFETSSSHGVTVRVTDSGGNIFDKAFTIAVTDVVERKVLTDINLDGRSDVLWQNTGGQAAVWTMNGSTVTGSSFLGGNPGPAWRLVDTGEFNGDGKADAVWQGIDGQAAIWTLDGASPTGSYGLSINPGPTWRVKAAADFDGDGRSELLWQNSDGTAVMWKIGTDLTITGGGALPAIDASWSIKAAADFNGDGKADVLWQHESGQAAVWLMDGTSIVYGAAIGFNPGSAWHVAGAGDFNGDGKSDFVWQTDAGEVAIWLMDGVNPVVGASLPYNPGPTWHVRDTGDYDGDGKANILLQNDDGSAATWTVDGINLIGGTQFGNPGAEWHVV